MKSQTLHAVAALLAAGAVSIATAQTQPDAAPAAIAAKPAPAPAVAFVDEPIASSSNTDELGSQIVQALNAEPALKNSKITVQADKGAVSLTGAAMTRGQVQKATEIAVAKAGEGNVTNYIVDSVS